MSEAAREQAQQRFAGTAAALQQIQREEKKSKRRDDSVAQAILQFLTDTQRTHLATLISRLVALNCPSPFILAILSLISPQCRTLVIEYLKESAGEREEQIENQLPVQAGELGEEANRTLTEWVARMDAVLHTDRENILSALIIAEGNIDGTILQLVTFVLQEFLREKKGAAAFEKLQPLAIGILHAVFEPHMREHEKFAQTLERESVEEGDRN